MISAATIAATTVVSLRLTSAPMTSLRAGEQHQRHERERDPELQHDLAR